MQLYHFANGYACLCRYACMYHWVPVAAFRYRQGAITSSDVHDDWPSEIGCHQPRVTGESTVETWKSYLFHGFKYFRYFQPYVGMGYRQVTSYQSTMIDLCLDPCFSIASLHKPSCTHYFRPYFTRIGHLVGYCLVFVLQYPGLLDISVTNMQAGFAGSLHRCEGCSKPSQGITTEHPQGDHFSSFF